MTEIEVVTPLSDNDRTHYKILKREARTGFHRAIASIREIRDRKLYREEYRTFEEFCQMEFGKTRQHINNLIRASQIEENLETARFQNEIEKEFILRPLSQLDNPADQKAALLLAYSAAPAATAKGQLTSAIVEESVATIKEMQATNGKVSLNGTMAAATASVIAKHNQRVKDAIQESNEKRGKSDGTVVLIAKHEKCKVVAVAGQRPRITFEFDDPKVVNKLLEMLRSSAGGNLEMKLTKHYPKKDDQAGKGA